MRDEGTKFFLRDTCALPGGSRSSCSRSRGQVGALQQHCERGSAVYVRMSCHKSQDNTRHGSLMLMLYMQTLPHTHEPTHTHTHTHAHTREREPGLELPFLYSSFGKQRAFSTPNLHSKFSLNKERTWERAVTLMTSERP